MLTKPPHPYTPPKPRRLPERKRMTIALGLLASDGLVIAADRQETHGNLIKLDQSKLHATATLTHLDGRAAHKENRAFVVAGSGDGHHIDAVGLDILRSAFSWEPPGNFADLLNGILKDFYRDHILPFAQYPEQQRPDVELILASSEGHGKRLWVSQKTVFKPAGAYVAIGIGELTAYPLLSRFYPPRTYPDLRTAIGIAAYVITHVKDFTEGCGKQTDLVALQDGRYIEFPQEQIDQLEQAVRDYSSIVEPTLFWKQMGAASSVEQRAASRAQSRFKRLLAALDLENDHAIKRLSLQSPKHDQ